jgi:cytochrome oxidase Cu insertion factor (SCO1/SenC/PrrC family)
MGDGIMGRTLRFFLIASALGLALGGCYQGGNSPPRQSSQSSGSVKEGIKIGDRAPDIQGEDADGKTFRLSDYRGKVVLLDFWAGW